MKKSLLLSFALLAFGHVAFAQLDRSAEDKKMAAEKMGWQRGGGIGLDLSGMGIANPRVGAGANRFGIGGIGTFFMNRKDSSSYWDNNGSLQLSLQRIGQTKPTDGLGFQKNLDILRLTSRYGRKLKGGKLYIAAEGMAQTLLLETYASNFLKQQNAEDNVVAKFFAPALLTFSPGLDWRPNPKYSVFLSPASVRLIFVGDDALANLNIHGNDIGKNNSLQVGANLVGKYTNKYLKERITTTSTLNLFSNYRRQPEKVDVIWQNNLSILIFKGLSLDLLGELYYDYDVFIKKDTNDDGIYDIGNILPLPVNAPQGTIPDTDGPDKLGRGAQLVGAFLLKYSMIF